MTMHNSQTLPITMAPAHRDVLPHAYVIRVRRQHCKCCGSLNQFSELYSKTHLRSQLGVGKYITNLRPLMPEGPLYDLPIETMPSVIEVIPFCHACHEPTLHDLPPLPTQDGTTNRIVGAPNDPKTPAKGGSTSAAKAAAQPARKAPVKKPTIDDLLF